MVEEKFIMKIQGRDFIKFEGLLDEFHKHGGKEIKTAVLNLDPLIIQATVSGEKGTFQGIGDANEQNVNKMILPHKIRMAETRSIARALRWYNNIGMTAAEEMGGDEEKHKAEGKCEKCSTDLTPKVKEFSMDKFGHALCFECQKKYKDWKKEKSEEVME